jgi:hypothetical protein
MKTCNCCRVEKDIVDFHKDKSRKDGFSNTCKICAIARVKKHYAKDPERTKTRVKNWIEANRDRHNQKCRKWVKNNMASVNARTARRYASRKNATPEFVRENLDFMWMIQQAYEIAKLRTEVTGVPWEVDHEIPLRGKLVSGLHTPWNLRVVPRSENRRKSNTFQVN